MTDEILSLQDKMKCLEKENQYLKSLLDQAGISYYASDEIENRDLFDPDQGARIIPREINYYTQCYNFWKTGCPRMNGGKIRCQDCKKRAYKKLEKQQIMAHLKGVSEDAVDVIGIYPLLEDDTCRFLVFDFDNHEKNAADAGSSFTGRYRQLDRVATTGTGSQKGKQRICG